MKGSRLEFIIRRWHDEFFLLWAENYIECISFLKTHNGITCKSAINEWLKHSRLNKDSIYLPGKKSSLEGIIIGKCKKDSVET